MPKKILYIYIYFLDVSDCHQKQGYHQIEDGQWIDLYPYAYTPHVFPGGPPLYSTDEHEEEPRIVLDSHSGVFALAASIATIQCQP